MFCRASVIKMCGEMSVHCRRQLLSWFAYDYGRYKKRLGMVKSAQIGTQMCERFNDRVMVIGRYLFCADVFEMFYS
jgi:hypothetical protein